jgi:hypothetical protein
VAGARPSPRLFTRLLAGVLAAALGITLVPGGARADGDPASDVLVAAPPLFLTQASGATFTDKQTLEHQLDTAARRGRPLRVAVIAARSDLGSVTALWAHPQLYAEFLGRELSLTYHGELLVVMPAGFGVTDNGAGRRTALAGLAPRSGQLVDATEQAIQRLTDAGPAQVSATAPAPAPSRIGGAGWWLATGAAGLLLIAAWAASLRRRPPRRRSAARRRRPHRT